ncbi:MAG: DNA repair protein RecO, partial [Spirochaetales bacterium]|nr:DNA repair protein RecO [Spirochaetales bacterium]
LGKFYIASFWSELLLRSFSGGGESELVYPLLAGSLKELNKADKAGQTLILIQFVWRYLGIAGFRPDTEHCGQCDRMFIESEQVWFDERDNQLICDKCRTSMDLVKFTSGSLKYLRHTEKLDLEKSMRIGLDDRSADTLKRIMLIIIQGIVEYPLNTLKNGLIP